MRQIVHHTDLQASRSVWHVHTWIGVLISRRIFVLCDIPCISFWCEKVSKTNGKVRGCHGKWRTKVHGRCLGMKGWEQNSLHFSFSHRSILCASHWSFSTRLLYLTWHCLSLVTDTLSLIQKGWRLLPEWRWRTITRDCAEWSVTTASQEDTPAERRNQKRQFWENVNAVLLRISESLVENGWKSVLEGILFLSENMMFLLVGEETNESGEWSNWRSSKAHQFHAVLPATEVRCAPVTTVNLFF